jgi:hypothetical protein
MEIRRLLLVILAVVLLGPTAGVLSQQLKPRSFLLKPGWKVGESARFELVKGKANRQGGAATPEGRSRTIVQLSVIAADENGYVLRWRQGETKLDDETIFDRVPIARRIKDMFIGVEVDLEVDPTGNLKGVRNWEMLLRKTQEVLAAMKEMLDNSDIDPKVAEFTMRQTSAMFKDRAAIETMFFTLAGDWFLMLGREYSESVTLKYDAEVSNLFGGEPFRAVDSFTLKSVANAAGHAVVGWERELDAEHYRKSMLQWMTTTANRAGRPAPTDADIPKLSINMTAESEVDPRTGWLQKCSRKSITSVGGNTVEEFTEIKRLPPEDSTP